MRLLTVSACIAVIAIAGCSSAASSSSPPASASAAAGPVDPGATAVTLGVLTLGHFPATADGKLAHFICKEWAGLRNQYVYKSGIDTAYEMNQWFSSPDWSAEMNDAATLGADPRFGNLETALGIATVGDDAGVTAAKAVDKACHKAD